MVRIKAKKEASIIFIDEEEKYLKDPLLPPPKKSMKMGRKDKKSFLRSKLDFPSTFYHYLIWKDSVVMKLFSSICPPLGPFKRVPVDYQGTLLSTFILTATLYYGLLTSKTTDSKLLAILYSLLISFGYLTCTSILVYILCKLSRTIISLKQIFSIIGHGTFFHGVTLLICEIMSDELFIPLMIVFAGLSSLRICWILMAITPIPACRFIICTPVGIIHMLFLVFAHFAIMRD